MLVSSFETDISWTFNWIKDKINNTLIRPWKNIAVSSLSRDREEKTDG